MNTSTYVFNFPLFLSNITLPTEQSKPAPRLAEGFLRLIIAAEWTGRSELDMHPVNRNPTGHGARGKQKVIDKQDDAKHIANVDPTQPRSHFSTHPTHTYLPPRKQKQKQQKPVLIHIQLSPLRILMVLVPQRLHVRVLP